ncbi:hypothetical protein FACS1894218_1340 [Bacilli bacterium]|nr:hypothetical protein FACS1894218_1340 [Bacilli bacterium]
MLVLLLPKPIRFNKGKFIHLLSAEDQNTASTIHNSIVRAQFIAGRLLLKESIYVFNQGKRINDVIFLDSNGKPKFKNSKIKFNISHTRELVACAIGYNDMGLDIETVDRTAKLPNNLTIKN